MKVTLKADSSIVVNGVAMTLVKGTEVDIPCQSPSHALELCSLAKLVVDLSFTEDGVKFIAGAAGKFVAVPVEEKPKAVKPKAPKAEVKADKPKTKAKKPAS